MLDSCLYGHNHTGRFSKSIGSLVLAPLLSSFCNASPSGFEGVDLLGRDRPRSIALAMEMERSLQCTP